MVSKAAQPDRVLDETPGNMVSKAAQPDSAFDETS